MTKRKKKLPKHNIHELVGAIGCLAILARPVTDIAEMDNCLHAMATKYEMLEMVFDEEDGDFGFYLSNDFWNEVKNVKSVEELTKVIVERIESIDEEVGVN